MPELMRHGAYRAGSGPIAYWAIPRKALAAIGYPLPTPDQTPPDQIPEPDAATAPARSQATFRFVGDNPSAATLVIFLPTYSFARAGS